MRVPIDRIDWADKNRTVRQIFLAHALGVADVMLALELACRASGRARLLYEDELTASTETNLSVPWKVDVEGRRNLGVVPDLVFALDFADEDGESERAFFFLEADRGTMPVIRENLSQTSFYRKLLAYEATWVQGIHRKRFGFHRFRVLTVTTSAARVQSLVDACSRLRSGHGLFLFADRSVLANPGILFSPIWRSGRDGVMASMFE